MLPIFAFVYFAACFLSDVDSRSAKLPAYIHLCKKNEPDMNKCLEELFESVRPRLHEGIPDVGLPPLEPLTLPEVVVFGGGNGQIRAIGRNIVINGIKDFKFNKINADVDNLQVEVELYLPYVRFEGEYDVNAKFVNIPVKGKGPMRGNASEITVNAILKGKFVNIKGKKHVQFYSADVDVDVKDYSIRVDKLFPDKQLNDAINVLLNDKKLQSMATAKPIVNKISGSMLLEFVNKIAENLSFEEVFAD